MAELFIQITVSVDGYIEDAHQGLDWMVFDASVDPYSTATLQSIDGMVFGRKAFALMQQFWPSAADTPDATPELVAQARLMNSLPKYVLTHGEETSGWPHCHAVQLADIARLKRDAMRPLALFAGASAAQSAMAAGLVDEIRLITQPVLLGGGTPLFVPGGLRSDLQLVEQRAFASGALLRRYRVGLA